jgi:hypothetical protein
MGYRTDAQKLTRRLNPDKKKPPMTKAQKDRAKEIRNMTRARKDRANELIMIKKGNKKGKEKKERELGQVYAQEGGTIEQLNELLEARRILEIAKQWARERSNKKSKNPEVIQRRQERAEDRRRKHWAKEMKQRAHHADCACCGYPRAKIGQAGKTEEDLWHEDHHEKFPQHPLQGEAYEQAKVAAAVACPAWFNRNFDESLFLN